MSNKVYNDYISGNPTKSGHYSVLDSVTGKVCSDDFTVEGHHWWNVGNDCGRNTDGRYLYSPSSFREL